MEFQTVNYISRYSNIIFYAICFMIFTGYILHQLFSKYRKIPGPITLPIVGYLPFIGKEPPLKFYQLSKKYGSVFGLYLGSEFVVVLNDYPAVKEALGKPELYGRPKETVFDIVQKKKSIANFNGKVWEEQRKFILRQFKDIGSGNRLENIIQEEVRYLMKTLEEKIGDSLDLQKLFTASISNNIVTFLIGKRVDHDDPMRKSLDEIFKGLANVFLQTAAYVFIPWIAPIFRIIGYSNYRETYILREKINDMARKFIAANKDSFIVSNTPNYMKAYLQQMKEDKQQNINTSFNDDNLQGNVIALIAAGSETVQTTLDWFFLAIAKFQNVQRKIQREIDDVVGRKIDVCWMDHTKMPYTRAAIMEIQRWRTVVALNLMRCALSDVSVQGFLIPKGTSVLVNIWAIHNNPEYWDNPEQYIPERFLSENGTDISVNEKFMPFSIGKRSCPGTMFTNMELFFYVTSILQKFNVIFPEGQTNSLKGNFTITFQPTEGKICLTERK